MNEQRKRERVDLHWKVRLLKDARREPVNGEIQNISSAGFFCLCPESFTEGEQVDCILEIPSHARMDRMPCLFLHCKARVVRVVGHCDTLFGIGFSIESYSVSTISGNPTL